MDFTKIWFISAILILAHCSAPPNQTSFGWDNVNGTSFVPQVYSQNYPAPCNSGWAFAAVDIFNSRMKIKRKGASPELQISTQVLLSCDETNFGCMGGDPTSAIGWIKKNNITDSSCQAYAAKGYTNGLGCSSQVKCQTCSDGECKATANSKIYAIYDYGTVASQKQMLDQIYDWGPIACGINSIGLLNTTNTSGIIKYNSSASNRIDHHVLVYGWGVQNGTKFWKAKNSWGSAWGEKGHFRIQRGKNVLGIQARCTWGSPLDTWTNDTRNKTIPNNILSTETIMQVQPQKLTYQVPAYLTPSRSALTPHDCTSSWAFATVQMIADRQSKKANGKNHIRLSVQGLINCGVGTCAKGGSPIDALIFIQKYGLSEENCQNYLGVDLTKQNCSGVSNCGYCVGSVFDYKCYQTKNYKRWKISDYGFFSGVQNMKNQLYQGPIVCGIHASEQLKKYKGGIFSEVSITPKIDHYVEVVGWGSEGGKNYWLARNFWGTAWGESSMFRILMGSNNLGIQTKCYFATYLM